MKCVHALRRFLISAVILMCGFLTAACNNVPSIPPLASNATILAFGDSLTYGTGAGEAESYPAVLARLTGHRVVNAGVPGEVSASGAGRLPELLDRERTALLILCHGGNDLLQRLDQRQLADNLRTMIKAARERGVAVVMVAVPSLGLSLKPPPLYREIAEEFAIPIESKALPRVLGKRSLKSDQVHPNAAGYRMLAGSIADLLKKSGALPR